MTAMYSLVVQSANGVTWERRKPPNLYVHIEAGKKEVGRTPTVKRELNPTWNKEVEFSSPPTNIITFRLRHHATFPLPDPCLGEFHRTINELLALQGAESVAKLDLKLDGRSSGMLLVSLRSMTSDEAVHTATADGQRLTVTTPIAAVEDWVQRGVDDSELVSPLGELIISPLGTVIKQLGILINIGDEITKIHPYAHGAWKILTVVYNVVKKQKETDDKLLKLLKTMAEVYSFVADVQDLPEKFKKLEATVLGITKESVECAIFIHEYTGRGFGGRLARHTWSDTSTKIDELSAVLLQLKEDFDRGISLHSTFISVKLLGTIQKLVELDKLKDLNPGTFDAALREECLVGTRTDILLQINDWLTMPPALGNEGGNILWLHGVVGSGKSTISTTVSEYFRSLHRLGAFIFFDRNNLDGSGPHAVIRSIAYGLADFDPCIRSAIFDVMSQETTLIAAPLRTQFNKLLLEPLGVAKEHIRGPIIIILDALDECGTPESRRSLVSLIANEFPKLPPIFRFFITSRPDSDIARPFHAQPLITTMELDITTPVTKEDILVYLRDNMKTIQVAEELGPEWPGEDAIQMLANYSSGLFIWASTVCKFIANWEPEKKLQLVLESGAIPGKHLHDIYNLYSLALQNLVDWKDQDFAQQTLVVLGSVVFGRVPMTDNSIDQLRGLRPGRSSKVLERLGCVLKWAPDKSVRTFHASFTDYLTDRERCGNQPWFIDSRAHNNALALGCLQLLNRELRFNICGLEDSRILNANVENLSESIQTHISPHLMYAAQFWADHLQDMDPEEEILSELKEFMEHHVLYWLEVLSLREQVPIATRSLNIGKTYAQGKNEPLANFIQDTLRFVSTFAPLIAQSAPHIYISALPFAPRQSAMRRQFSPSFPNTLVCYGTLADNWPSIQKELRGHTSHIFSAAFSQDGKQIVSGSGYGTMCIWDSETGALTRMFEGNTEWVTSVAISRDGKLMVFGTGAYRNLATASITRIWDSDTGVVVGTFTEHTRHVMSVAFSPDGKWIASGSKDQTIRLWDSDTGRVTGVFEGHRGGVTSVAFSPDGKDIVSGSDDMTVRVWDCATGLLTGYFDGYNGEVNSVAFAPAGKQIVSGSEDGRVRVLNFERRVAVVVPPPFLEYTQAITSVAFSPDGQRIVSGASDNTVHIWNSQTGSVVAGPFAHTSTPYNRAIYATGTIYSISIALSSDGKHIVSGSSDTTIYARDSETGALTGRFEGHTEPVTSVAFSPDSKWVVSGSWDTTVRVWDLKTAVAVAKFECDTRVNSVAFSPDGKLIVSGLDDCTLRIWDSETGTAARNFEGHTAAVSSVAFSPDGQHIVSGSRDRTVHVWDSRTGLVVLVFKEQKNWVTCVSFSPDGKHIASVSAEAVNIWDSSTGVVTASFEYRSFISAAFSPDGRQLVVGYHPQLETGRNTLDVWDMAGAAVTGPFRGHVGAVTCVAFSPDGKRVVSGGRDQTVRVWNATTGAVVAGPLRGHTDAIESVAYSPDSKRIVSGSRDCTIRVWDADTAAVAPGESEVDAIYRYYYTSIAFSPDGERIVSGSHNHLEGHTTVSIWDSETGSLAAGPFTSKDSEPPMWHFKFSQNGKGLIISTKNCNTTEVWDSKTGSLVAGPFTLQTEMDIAVSLSPDYKRLLLGSQDGAVRVCDSKTLAVVAGPFATGSSESVKFIEFCPDGKHIVFTSKEVPGQIEDSMHILDSETGAVLTTPFLDGTYVTGSLDGKVFAFDTSNGLRIWNSENGSTTIIETDSRRVAVSPDGRQVVTSSWGGGRTYSTVSVWNAETGDLVVRYEIPAIIDFVVFSPDGRRFAAGFDDGSIRVWNVQKSDLWGQYPHFTEGWLINSSSQNIIWVPPALRQQLWLPWNSTLISPQATIKLDLTHFVHGTEWQHCIEPKVRDAR
ncbi:hypothetical protein C8R44DRAFT_884905 [Mycena epipterygia]|nr:hypothetical protein C8R44DRAFT_884905 [Mycena epipterygia]